MKSTESWSATISVKEQILILTGQFDFSPCLAAVKPDRMDRRSRPLLTNVQVGWYIKQNH